MLLMTGTLLYSKSLELTHPGERKLLPSEQQLLMSPPIPRQPPSCLLLVQSFKEFELVVNISKNQDSLLNLEF